MKELDIYKKAALLSGQVKDVSCISKGCGYLTRMKQAIVGRIPVELIR